MSAVDRDARPAAPASGVSQARAEWREQWHTLLLSIIPMLVIAVLGLFRLGVRPLSLDETTSYFLTEIGWGRFAEVVADSKVNMSLYFSLLRLWPFTSDEAGLRALSVLFGLLTVPPLVALARRVMPDVYAVAVALVLAVNPLYLYEVRDARGYSLVALLVLLGTWLFVVAMESRRSWAWVAWGATMALSLFAHFFAAFVLLAHLAVLLWTRPALPRGPAIAAGVFLAAAAVPIGLTVLLAGGTTLAWVQPTTWQRLQEAFVALGGSRTALVVYALGLFLALSAAWRWPTGWALRTPLALHLVTLAAVLPPVLIVLLSLVKPVLVDRYLLVALPFVIIATIAALVATSARLATAALAILLVVSGVGAYGDLRDIPEKPPSWVRHLIENAEEGDGTYFAEAQYRKVLAYYLPESLLGSLRLATSDAPIDHNPYEPWPPTRGSFAQLLDEMPCRHERVWLIGGPGNLDRVRGSTMKRMVAALAASYTETDAKRFGNRWIRLWERDADLSCA